MFMRCILAVAAFSGAAGVAAAADLPLRSPPPTPYYPAPVYSWTGFYAGLNVGGAFDNQSGALVPQGFGGGLIGTTASDSSNGFLVGGQLGYNWQSGAIVYGFETDIDYANLGGGGTTTSAATPFGASTLSVQREDGSGFLGTARGRLGYAGFDRTLLYVTGGLAYGDFGSRYKSASFLTAGGLTAATYGRNSESDDVRVGYAIGAGIEYAVTPNISVKGEYLFVDLGRTNYSLQPTSVNGAGTAFTSHIDGSAQTVKIGLNYKFNAF